MTSKNGHINSVAAVNNDENIKVTNIYGQKQANGPKLKLEELEVGSKTSSSPNSRRDKSSELV